VKRIIDVTVPFVAIRKDLPGDEFEPTMGEYLCNPLKEDMLDVEISTGGFFSDDELGVIESIPQKPKPTYTIPAGECVRVTLSTQDEYDEMVVHWSLRYRTARLGVQTESFGSFKRLEDTQALDDVPVLGGPGMVVPRTAAD